jgi:hypothetical protein
MVAAMRDYELSRELLRSNNTSTLDRLAGFID